MGLCGKPEKKIDRAKKYRKRKSSWSQGRNAGHRYRGQPKMETLPIDWVKHQPAKVPLTPPPAFPIEVSPETHEMWDTHGFFQIWYNPLMKEDYSSGDPTINPISDGAGPIISFGNTSPSARQSVRDTIPFLSEADLDELILRSEEKLSEVVNQNVSLANFIIELMQLCQGNVKSIRRFSDIYTRALEAFQKEYKRLLKAGHKQGAAYWLAWNFAIKPAIKDLRSILCGISDAYARMAWLKNHNHKIVYLDYHRKDLGDKLSYDPNAYSNGQHLVTVVGSFFPNQLANGSYIYRVRHASVKLTYHARSKIFLDIPDEYLEGMKGIGTLWEAMQGLHNPVGIIWEAIPFSWLIDYFLSYRARLFQRMFDYNPYNEGVTVLGYGHSFVIESVGDWHVYNSRWSTIFQNMGGFKYRCEVRRAGLPTVANTTLFRVPFDWYKGSIIGALGVGILPRRR